jgi:putative ABC transport system ATP-binding protein
MIMLKYSQTKKGLLMSTPLLEAHGISQAFDYTLFTDVSFALGQHESAAVVGRSGSGKSTLLHIMATFLPPDSGSVRLFGKELYTQSEAQIEALRRFEIGIIFQFHYLFKGMKAIDNIEIATILAREEVDHQLLKKLQIDHLMSHKTSELSGGEQQRVSIARVLSKKPRIIFADEPTGNLDKETASLVLDVLSDYVAENDAALMLVTHDDEMASRCQKIYRLKDKQLQLER